MPRRPNRRRIHNQPAARRFGPYDQSPPGEVVLSLEGLEALRHSDVELMDQESAAELMGVSRQTYGRVLAAARRAVATAITGGLALNIEGGHYRLVEPGPGPGPGRGGGRGGGRGRGRGRR